MAVHLYPTTGRRLPLPMVLPAVFCLLVPVGCWTRLTTPKESFLYKSDEEEKEGQKAPVLTAPQYQAILKKIEEKDGPEQYRMVIGTRVNLEVYGHQIKESLNIRPDGIVDLPLIGDVKAEGKTIPELKKEISTLYKPFFQQEPQIILNTDRESDLIGLGGRAGEVAVINPKAGSGSGTTSGRLTINGDEHLSQVLASVNGLTTEAEWRQIAVIRKSRDKKNSVIILCDMERFIKFGDLQQDVHMRNGDVVFIPVERHTAIQEIWATLGMVAVLTGNANTITDYIERLERY
jgi:polysaccharide biosynthesis/export protein